MLNARQCCLVCLIAALGLAAVRASAQPPSGAAPSVDAPRWTVWAGAIFLTRSTPRAAPLVVDGVDPLVDAGDLHFNTQAGPDVNLLRHGPDFDINVRYFQVNDMSASRTLFPPNTVDLLLNTPLSVDCPRLDTTYGTSLQSVEVNFRQNVSPQLTLLAGFRYLSLRDHLSFGYDDVNDSAGPIGVTLSGLNNLFGAQMGADAILWSAGRFQLQSALEAGVFGNSAQSTLDLSQTGAFGPPLGAHAQPTAFVGDLNFTGLYQLTEHWAVRAGYQLLWISGVALASEQTSVGGASVGAVATQAFFQPSFPIATSGDVFFHGALVSAQANW
jgi:hypothetical protein